jgi:mRNA interferase MazF
MTLCRGDIWLINLNPSKKPNEVAKIRPALILQNNELNDSKYPTTIILPMTTQLIDDAEPLRYRVDSRDKLKENSDILIAHIRAIDNKRFIDKLSSLNENELKEVKILLDELLI